MLIVVYKQLAISLIDRMVGQKKLHPNVVIVAAGNHVSSNAAVDMSTAMQSR